MEDLQKVRKAEDYHLKGKNYKVEIDDFFGRTSFMTFFVKEFLQNFEYFKLPNESIIYSVDETRKLIRLNSEMTAAYNMCLDKNTNIIFGAPPLGLVLEDLALNTPLEELQRIFEETRRILSEGYSKFNSYPFADPDAIVSDFRLVAKDFFPNELFAKRMAFNSCVADITSSNFHKTMILASAPLIGKIKELKYFRFHL